MHGAEQLADTLGWAPYFVLSGYLLVLLGLGWLGYRRSKTEEEDYYLAGRQQGWLVTGLTIMATFFSSFALLGAPGLAYKEGVVFALFSLNVPVAGLCVYLLGERIRRIGQAKGYVTPADMVADYYGSPVALRLLVFAAGFLYTVPYIMMQIKAGGLLSAKLFPGENSFEIGAVLLAAVTTVYIMVGGMRSVAWTDVLQGALLTAGMLLAGGAMIYALGGPGQFGQRIARLPDSSLTVPGTTGNWPWPMLLTVCLFSSSGSMVQPAQWMRYYSARGGGALKRGAVIFAMVLPACFLFGIMIVGVGGQVLYPLEYDAAGDLVGPNPQVGEYDQVLVVFLNESLPKLLGGVGVVLASLVLVAIMAASMSTADSSLHALSGIATRDIYDRFLRPKASQRERVWAGRTIIVGATAAALAIILADQWLRGDGDHARDTGALQFMEHIAILGLVAISFSAQLLPLAIDMLFLRKGTRAGAIVGLTAGLLGAFVFGQLFPPVVQAVGADGWIGGLMAGVNSWKRLMPIHSSAWGLLLNVPLFALVSLLTRSVPTDRKADFAAAIAGRSVCGLPPARQ